MTKFETIKSFVNQILSTDGMEIGNPVILDEISFVPIIKHVKSRQERDYLTLEEALEEGACKILDKGTEVAHIVIENLRDLPILIEEGEIFKGQGTQDRISVGTVMVMPQSKMEVGVKCVHAPHSLRSGASFAYGGKASRGMLNEMRSMKYSHALGNIGASTIDQSRVWGQVSAELDSEAFADKSKYLQSIETRHKKAIDRSSKLNFPENTIGFVVVDAKGEVKGLEIHRTPRNFKIRKEGILQSVEPNILWKPEGKGPYKNPKEKVKEVLKKIATLKEGKDAVGQVEVEGLVINKEGLAGEAFSTTFYSEICPSCNGPKPRKKVCPRCGAAEEDSDEFAYMSFF